MNDLILRVEKIFHFSHEFNTQVTVVENNPLTGNVSLIDKLFGWSFLGFTHGYFTCWELFVLSSIVIN